MKILGSDLRDFDIAKHFIGKSCYADDSYEVLSETTSICSQGTLQSVSIKDNRLIFNVSGDLYRFISVDEILPKGGQSMNMGDVLMMKVLSSAMSGKDMDLGKIYLLQQLANGNRLQITDIIKSKLIKQFGLDGEVEDLSIDKIMLLQMLNSEEVDLSSLLMVKMLGGFFDEQEVKS